VSGGRPEPPQTQLGGDSSSFTATSSQLKYPTPEPEPVIAMRKATAWCQHGLFVPFLEAHLAGRTITHQGSESPVQPAFVGEMCLTARE
jgi:hypothetical protein